MQHTIRVFGIDIIDINVIRQFDGSLEGSKGSLNVAVIGLLVLLLHFILSFALDCKMLIIAIKVNILLLHSRKIHRDDELLVLFLHIQTTKTSVGMNERLVFCLLGNDTLFFFILVLFFFLFLGRMDASQVVSGSEEVVNSVMIRSKSIKERINEIVKEKAHDLK